MDLRNVAEICRLVALFLVPGAVILLLLRRSSQDAATALVGAFLLSLTYDVMVGLVLLRFGWFNDVTMSLAVGAIALALPLRPAVVRQNALRWWRTRRTLLAPGAVAVGVAVAILVTPRWNFLVATNMDAGNYEVYSNHFWRAGELYLDAGRLRATGIPMEWIHFKNTWLFEGAVGRPAYFYAYPVLLGITKSTFDSYAVAWIFNGLIASGSAFALVVLARRFVPTDRSAAVVVLPAIVTPVFFYYSKQVMSEGLALFAVTAILVFLTSTEGRQHLVPALVVGAGTALLLLAKIDMIVPVLLLVGTVVWVFLTCGRQVVPRGSALGLMVGFSVAVGMDSWLVADKYLAKLSPSTYFKMLQPSSLAGDRVFLVLLAGVVVCLAFAVRIGGDEGVRLLNGASFARVVAWAIVVIWWMFVLWNLTVRPDTGSLSSNHDALNLVRLLAVFSPLAIAVTVLGAPTLMRFHGLKRWLGYGLIIVLGLLVLRSAHTRSEVWWMRRYLPTIVPASVLVGAATIAWLGASAKRWSSVAVGVFSLVFVGASVTQGLDMRPLFAHEVNVNAPDRVSRVLREVPDQAPLVVVGDGPVVIQGLGNILRSLRSAPTLLDVPPDELSRAMGLIASDHVAVIAPSPLPEDTVQSLGLRFEFEGSYAAQWENWLGEIAEDPAREQPHAYYLYERTESVP